MLSRPFDDQECALREVGFVFPSSGNMTFGWAVGLSKEHDARL